MRKTRISYRKITSKKGCEQSQDGREIGWGDHFLPHKLIKRSFGCWATSTKQLLNTGGGHQVPRKAAGLFKRGQNIQDKRRDERVRDGDLSWGGSDEVGEVSHSRKPSQRRVGGKFWNLRRQHNREKKKTRKTPQNIPLTTTREKRTFLWKALS